MGYGTPIDAGISWSPSSWILIGNFSCWYKAWNQDPLALHAVEKKSLTDSVFMISAPMYYMWPTMRKGTVNFRTSYLSYVAHTSMHIEYNVYFCKWIRSWLVPIRWYKYTHYYICRKQFGHYHDENWSCFMLTCMNGPFSHSRSHIPGIAI